jgi:acetolactate synthase-1/2/3 large subunit/5-guanidino-2-oxopentanoate decarboxylase
MLKARGVDVIFGIPGVHNQELYRGIEEAGIRHVLARHEQGAGFMADGYARATGKPGVAYLITGPGLTNALTPLGQAYSDSVPVLAISSCLDDVAARRGQLHQMLDQRAAGAAVCDWSEEAATAQAAYALIERAFTEFSVARRRSKHLQVPIPLLEGQADDPPLPPVRPAPAAARDTDIGATMAALQAAEKPLFIFGGGALGAADSIPALLHKTGAASFTTYAGRGLVPADAPLHFGSFLARPDSDSVLAEADLVVVVGSELAEVDLWRETPDIRGRMIRIDLDPEVLATCRPGDLPVLGDAGQCLAALAAGLPETGQSRWEADTIARIKSRWRGEIDAERPGISPVVAALQAVMPDEAMIYSDMTTFAYAAKEIWDMPRPGHWHHPTGFGTLGYALPASIGGAVARPGLPTVCIIGDYGFQYTLPELAVAVELGLPLPIFLWDNKKLGEIEASMIRAQIAPNAVEVRNPDFAALARAYGAYAVSPRDLTALQQAVTAAFSADGPTIIHVPTDIAL